MNERVALTNEPNHPQIERLVTGEERASLTRDEIPEDVKSETLERLEAFRESDLEHERREDVGNEP